MYGIILKAKKTYLMGLASLDAAALSGFFLLPVLALSAFVVQANTLNDISYSSLSGGSAQLTLQMAEPAEEPMIFTIENPARIAIDLKDTQNSLSEKSKRINAGVVTGYSSAEAKDRTRVVVSLVEMATYETKVNGNQIVLTLGGAETTVIDTSESPVVKGASGGDSNLRKIDFRRGEKGEGLIEVVLPNPKTIIDMRQEAEKVVVEFKGVGLPVGLQRSLDVKDFATPVSVIDTYGKEGGVRMDVMMTGDYEQLAYQSNEQFIIEVRPVSVELAEEAKKKKGYTGEKLSLNFQDIEVRSVLQLLADFTGLNVVVSDTVAGNLTLRLKSVPWDQALDIILKTKGLAKRQTGNVMLIAPAAEIANQERLELEASQQISELAPLQTEYIRVNYANAANMVTLISAEGNSLLSERGSISVDERTNTLLVRDTASQIGSIRALVSELDIPIRQVMIESRIVSASDTFTKSLGVRFGWAKSQSDLWDTKGTGYQIGGTKGGVDIFQDGSDKGTALTNTNNLIDSADLTGFQHDNDNEAYIVDLPITGSAASMGLAIGKMGAYLLQLELMAGQQEGTTEIISSPRLITGDKTEATITDGFEIPYQEASASGATSVTWREAALSLSVTPQITPDDRLIMDLAVNNDRPQGDGSIRAQKVSTQVIVDNGETVVLGGVYSRDRSDNVERVPFFSDLPYVGWAFRSKTQRDIKTELLIFVTPKILDQASSLN